MSAPRSVDEGALAASLVATVPNLMRHLLAHARRRPAWADMTYQQYNVLRIIAGGEEGQGEVARRLLVSPPVVTRLVSALVEAGLVERRDDPSDRRSVLLRLTPLGDERVDAMRRDLEGAARELVEPIPAEERPRVADALDQLQLLLPERSAPR